MPQESSRLVTFSGRTPDIGKTPTKMCVKRSDPLDVCKTVAIFFQKSRYQLAKKGVEGSDPLDVCKIVVIFLHLVKANHHVVVQKRV